MNIEKEIEETRAQIQELEAKLKSLEAPAAENAEDYDANFDSLKETLLSQGFELNYDVYGENDWEYVLPLGDLCAIVYYDNYLGYVNVELYNNRIGKTLEGESFAIPEETETCLAFIEDFNKYTTYDISLTFKVEGCFQSKKEAIAYITESLDYIKDWNSNAIIVSTQAEPR
jgi:restriction endonuclease S subunit